MWQSHVRAPTSSQPGCIGTRTRLPLRRILERPAACGNEHHQKRKSLPENREAFFFRAAKRATASWSKREQGRKDDFRARGTGAALLHLKRKTRWPQSPKGGLLHPAPRREREIHRSRP